MAIDELELESVDQATANVADDLEDVHEVVADDLVEDVSIDGMCGVY